MGSKRIGLARTQALLENLKRQLSMGGSTVEVGKLRVGDAGGIVKYQGAEATSADDTSVVTAANVLTGIVKCTPTGARSKATDTAANFVSGLGLSADGDSFDFSFINLSTTDAHIITLTAGTGVTIVGNEKINPEDQAADAVSTGSAMFRVRRTSATAVTLYRLA